MSMEIEVCNPKYIKKCDKCGKEYPVCWQSSACPHDKLLFPVTVPADKLDKPIVLQCDCGIRRKL